MDLYVLIKTLHILSATVLFGTGLGTAFFMLRGQSAPDLQTRFAAARTTVLADYIFTAPAAVLQPLTGIALILLLDLDPWDFWLMVSYGLFLLAGLCWLPVVWIQIRLKKLLQQSIETGDALPESYRHLFRIWFALGWPAFLALIVIFYLMVAKPTW